MTWLRQAQTGEDASDITDKGDAFRLGASGHIELTILYVCIISMAVPGVKGMKRAQPKMLATKHFSGDRLVYKGKIWYGVPKGLC